MIPDNLRKNPLAPLPTRLCIDCECFCQVLSNSKIIDNNAMLLNMAVFHYLGTVHAGNCLHQILFLQRLV